MEPASCRAIHPAGLALEQPPTAPERLIVTADIADPAPLSLRVEGRPVLSAALAPLDGQAQATFPDARVFWRAFGQADTLAAGDLGIALADQAALRDALTTCASRTEARDA